MFNIDEFMQKYCKPEITQDYLDLAYGANRTLNGLSWGGLDYLGRRTGFDAPMTEYLNLLPAEEREKRERLGDMVQLAGAGLSTGTFLRSIPTIGANIVRWNGRRDLIEQLNRGLNFKDINFGRMNNQTLNEINFLREESNLPKLRGNAYIPANVVKKFYDKRLKEKYTAEQIADMGRRLFQEPGGIVSESLYPHVQQVCIPKKQMSDVGYVSQNPANGQTVIKSIYKKDTNRIKGL